MTKGVVKTQGTELFLVDTVTESDPQLLKLACPTGITGLGGAADQVEDTCLDNLTDRTYQRGLGNPGQVTVPFNFIPSHQSHQVLFELKDAGDVLDWMIALSDGTSLPEIDTDASLVPPPSPERTTAEFQAYIADVNIDIATNEIVRGTLTLQRSGAVVWHWNGPVPE